MADWTRRNLIHTAPLLALGACASTPTQNRDPRDWAPAIGAFEHAQSSRTSLFDGVAPRFSTRGEEPIATIPTMPGLWAAAFDAQGRGFALHGVIAEAPGVRGPAISRFDPETMREVWRVDLPMRDDPGLWNYPGGLGVHASGAVFVAYAARLAKLDPESGAVLALRDLPAPNGLLHSTYNGFIVLSDGMILAKSHHRQPDCPVQGFRAFIECGVDGLPASALALIDPSDLSIIWEGVAPELIGGRVSSTRFAGREYVYLAGANAVHRMIYDGRRLTLDPAWGPVAYRDGAETPGTAVVGFGDYVAVQNNALPTAAPMRVTVIAQADARDVYRIAPFADLGQLWSFMPSKVSTDAINGRLYSAEAYGGLAALELAGGQLRAVWRRPLRTGSFVTLMGDRANRVLVASDIGEAPIDRLGAPTHRTETARWLRAADGVELTHLSGLPRNFGLTLTPFGDGSLFYATRVQGLYRLRPPLPQTPGDQ